MSEISISTVILVLKVRVQESGNNVVFGKFEIRAVLFFSSTSGESVASPNVKKRSFPSWKNVNVFFYVFT